MMPKMATARYPSSDRLRPVVVGSADSDCPVLAPPMSESGRYSPEDWPPKAWAAAVAYRSMPLDFWNSFRLRFIEKAGAQLNGADGVATWSAVETRHSPVLGRRFGPLQVTDLMGSGRVGLALNMTVPIDHSPQPPLKDSETPNLQEQWYYQLCSRFRSPSVPSLGALSGKTSPHIWAMCRMELVVVTRPGRNLETQRRRRRQSDSPVRARSRLNERRFHR